MLSRFLAVVLLGMLPFVAVSPVLAQGQAPAYQPTVAVFDGKNSATFPAAPSLNVNGLATVEFWVSPRWTGKLGYDPVLISYTGPDGPRFAVAMSDDKKAIGIIAGAETDYVTFDFSDGRMHHVAFVFGEDTADVYINGVFVDTLAIAIADVPATAFILGSANGTDMSFKGGLADVRLWNTALDLGTIAAWRLGDPLRPGAKHPAVNSLIGRSSFANGRRGFALAQPPMNQDVEALLQAAKTPDEPPAPIASEDAQ